MNAWIKEVIDYTLKRKGDRIYYLVDAAEKPIPMTGCWKTKKAAMDELNRKGFQYNGIITVHQNHSHWAGWQPAK